MAAPKPTTSARNRLKPGHVLNDVPQLRQLLLELYVSSRLWDDSLPEAEQIRLLDTVLAAGEGKPFKPLGLPFPRHHEAGPETPPASTDQDA